MIRVLLDVLLLTTLMAKKARLTLAMIADVSPEAVTSFGTYEREVLALLPRHGGRLEHRLRSDDGLSEVHIVSFESRDGYENYLNDPEPQGHRPLIDGKGIKQRLLEVTDV